MFAESYYTELARTMDCPRCGRPACRDGQGAEDGADIVEVDNGVGIIVGPFGCPCGWSEDEEYDVTAGPKLTPDGYELDQWGGATPPQIVESEIKR